MCCYHVTLISSVKHRDILSLISLFMLDIIIINSVGANAAPMATPRGHTYRRLHLLPLETCIFNKSLIHHPSFASCSVSLVFRAEPCSVPGGLPQQVRGYDAPGLCWSTCWTASAGQRTWCSWSLLQVLPALVLCWRLCLWTCSWSRFALAVVSVAVVRQVSQYMVRKLSNTYF